MTTNQEITNTQRGREDLVQTGGISGIVLGLVEIARHYQPDLPWALFMPVIVAFIAFASAYFTKRMHANKAVLEFDPEKDG